MIPDPAPLMRFLVALNDDCEAGVEELLWDAVRDELRSVHEQPYLARQPTVPIVSWSQKWGWQRDWDKRTLRSA